MKRDINYIIKRVIIGLLIVLILSFLKNCQVKAETIVSPDAYLKIGGYSSFPRIYNNGYTSGQTYALEYAFAERQTKFNYLIIDVCTQGDFSKFSVLADSCTNSCFQSGTMITYQYDTCDIAGYGAKRVYLQLNVKKSYLDPNTTYFVINNTIRFVGYGYYSETRVEGFYGSSEDEITQLWSGQKNVNDIKSALATQTTTITNSIDNSTNSINNNINNATSSINGNLNDIESSINDDNVSGANSQVDSLLNNSAFQDSTGLTAVISTPLNFISSLNNTCIPINLTLPYFKNNTQVTLPCISSLLQSKIPTVKSLLSIVINGFIIYRVLIELFYIVKSARNPEDDRIEVLDL